MISILKRIEKGYKESISKMPIDKVVKMVYKEEFKYMELLRDNSEEAQKHWNTIVDLLENTDFKYRALLFHTMYNSLLLFHFKHSEEWYKLAKERDLETLIAAMADATLLKCFSDWLTLYKKTGDEKYLENIQNTIDYHLKGTEKIFDNRREDLFNIMDVLEGNKPEIELFRTSAELNWLKEDDEHAYNTLVDVYKDGTFVKGNMDSKDDILKYIKSIILGKFFYKVEGYFVGSEAFSSDKSEE